MVCRAAFAIAAFGVLSACEQNTFVPPPPPKVEVALPAQGSFTRYLEATGNTAPVKNVDLVARVQGFLQSIEYKDGAFVKEGAPLFTIEPETYKLKLEQAQAAETGAQAVEKYRQLKPDLVTMDIVMPDMGGIEAVREICKDSPDAKILMCSAMGQQALVVEAIQAGAKDFVVKPFQPSRVLEAVQRVLG